MSKPSSPPRRPLTPLWIIALFVSLVETVLVVGVIQTRGTVQLALVAFVILFPLLVASGFFAILWDRPHVLYPPAEFGRPDVEKFARAMRRPQEAVRAALVSD